MKNFENSAQSGTEEDVKLLTGMIIHTSDFTGGAKPFPISKEWSTRVNMEFQEQYTLEGKFGYPQLPYMKDLDQVISHLSFSYQSWPNQKWDSLNL